MPERFASPGRTRPPRTAWCAATRAGRPRRHLRRPRRELQPEGDQAIASKVFVGNLSYYTTESQLADLLAEAGQVVDVYLPADRNTGRPRGFAFVEFSNEDEAEKCIEKFHEYELEGRKLNINMAEDRPQRAPRPFRPGPGPGGPRFGGKGGGKPSRPKGSRRGKRGKKRSL